MHGAPAPGQVGPRNRQVAPGKLILVVGPSGAGKDTLIDAARTHYGADPDIMFCERFITRRDQLGEPHAAISEAEFASIAKAGGFLLAWEAHGLRYGVPAAVLGSLQNGKTVVVNTSRQIIEEARQKWPATYVIHITAEPEVLRRRLNQRGRETSAGVDHRLKRAIEVRCPEETWIVEVDNSGTLAEGSAHFNDALARVVSA